MWHDDELPIGFQDADFEAAALRELADRSSRLRKVGKCTHGWRRTPPGTDVCTCLECGKVGTWQELEDERRQLLM